MASASYRTVSQHVWRAGGGGHIQDQKPAGAAVVKVGQQLKVRVQCGGELQEGVGSEVAELYAAIHRIRFHSCVSLCIDGLARVKSAREGGGVR